MQLATTGFLPVCWNRKTASHPHVTLYFSNNCTFSQQLRYSPLLSFLSPFETSFSLKNRPAKMCDGFCPFEDHRAQYGDDDTMYPHYHIKTNFSVPFTTDQFKSTCDSMDKLLEIGMFKDFQRDPELSMKKLYLRLINAYENESFLPQRYWLVPFSPESMSLIREGYRTHVDYPLLYFLAFFTHVSKSLEALGRLYIGRINVRDPNADDRQYKWKVRITQIPLDTFATSKIPLEINEIMTFLSKSFGNDWNSVVTNQALYANQLQKKLHGNFVITIEERENLEKKFKPVAMVVVEQKEFPTPIACIHYLVTSNHNSTHDLHKYKERGMGQLLIQAATRLRIDEEAWNCAYPGCPSQHQPVFAQVLGNAVEWYKSLGFVHCNPIPWMDRINHPLENLLHDERNKNDGDVDSYNYGPDMPEPANFETFPIVRLRTNITGSLLSATHYDLLDHQLEEQAYVYSMFLPIGGFIYKQPKGMFVYFICCIHIHLFIHTFLFLHSSPDRGDECEGSYQIRVCPLGSAFLCARKACEERHFAEGCFYSYSRINTGPIPSVAEECSKESCKDEDEGSSKSYCCKSCCTQAFCQGYSQA